ncbi:hypothetical protein M0802_011011 [Mischocyttarus mexicanus]|nr:hypothetical protein M0802_011011 [Mischocyttarus mexicanus]
MAWTIGLIAAPAIGWLVIPLQFDINAKPFSFHSWNLFVIICSLPSLKIGFWTLYFSESPKFLAENMQMSELSMEILAKSKNPLYDTLKMNNYKNSNEISKIKSWRSIVNSMYIQTVSLFKVPHIMKSLNVFILIACITASYYTLMLWFPELFQRFAKYEKMYPEKSASVCKISKINLHDNNKTLASNGIRYIRLPK